MKKIIILLMVSFHSFAQIVSNEWNLYSNGTSDKIISNKIRLTENDDLGFNLILRCDNWKDTSEITMIISNNQNLDDFKYVRLKDKISNHVDNQNQEFLLTKSDFVGLNGKTVTWYDVEETILLKIVSKTDKKVNLILESISLIPSSTSSYISIDFDDGRIDNYWGKKIMDKYGFKGNAYIISEKIGTETYLNKKQLDELSKDGWDISGHGYDNLKTIINIESDIKRQYEFLKKYNYKGKEFYAYPNGVYDENIIKIVSKYFKYGRTINPMSINNEYFNKMTIPAYTIVNTDKVEDVKKIIDNTIKDKKWLHIVFHKLSDKDSKIESVYNINKFEEIIKYIKSIKIEVKTNSELLSY